MSITRAKTSSVAQGPTTRKTISGGNDVILPGGYDAIGDVVVGSGGATSVSFSSISSAYTHLELRWIYRMKDYSAQGSQAYLYFNGVRNGQYSLHILYATGAVAGASASTSLSETYIRVGTGPTALTNNFGAGVTSILDYKNTNKNKTILTLGGYDNNGSGSINLTSGLIPVTAALSSFVITPQDGNFAQYSQFSLYGIK